MNKPLSLPSDDSVNIVEVPRTGLPLVPRGDAELADLFDEIEVPHAVTIRPTFVRLLKPVSAKTQDELRSLFNIQVSSVTVNDRQSGVHPHPKLAACRVLGERAVHKHIARITPNASCIHEIAGNVRRTDDLRILPKETVIHVSTPLILLPNDAARARSAEDRGRQNHCYHRLEDETCGNRVPFDAAMSTHVLYYIDAEVLGKYMLSQLQPGGAVYSVHHLFDGDEGEFTLGAEIEAKWWRKSGQICMNVAPFKTLSTARVADYTHPDQPYLRNKVTNLRDGKYLFNEVIGHFGDVWVSRLTIHQGAADDGSMKISGTQLTYLLPNYSVARKYDVLVPDRAVAFVASKLVNRKRDASASVDATYHARRAMRDLDIPVVDQPAAIAVVASKAMTLTLQLETDLMVARERESGALMRYHANALSGVSLPWYRHILDYALDLRLPSLGTVWNSGPHEKRSEMESWVDSANEGSPNSLISAPLYGPASIKATAIVDEKFPEMDPGLSVRVQEDVSIHCKEDKDVMFLEGFATTSTPSVFKQDLTTLNAAVRQRYTLVTPEIDVIALNAAIEAFKCTRVWSVLKSKRYEPPSEIELFERWLIKQPRGLSPAYRRAFESIKASPVGDEQEDYVRSLFVKLEKSQANSNTLGTPSAKPRVIAAMSSNHRMKVATCPLISDFQNWLFGTLRSEDSPIIATPGMTCEEISEFYADNGVEPTAVLNADQIKMDAHMRHLIWVAAINLLVELGLEPEVAAIELEAGNVAVNADRTLKVSPSPEGEHGTDRLCSGDGITTLLGTFVNIIILASFFHMNRIMAYRSVVSGDDSSTKLRRADLYHGLDDAFDAHCRKLGFESECLITFDPWKEKYCSKMFWPIIPEQRRGGVEGFLGPNIMLGPLPGRLLGKIAWTIKHPKEGNFRGTLIALSRDAAHVPFVRVYVRRMLKLTVGQKAKFSSHYAYGNQTTQPYQADEGLVWTWMAERYGLTWSDEDEFDEFLGTIKTIPCVMTNRVMERLIEVDSGKSASNDVGGLY